MELWQTRNPTLHFWQRIRFAIVFGQEGVGFLVTAEPLGFGIKTYVSFEVMGNVAQVADRCAEATNFDVGTRLLTALDAVEKIFRVRTSRRLHAQRFCPILAMYLPSFIIDDQGPLGAIESSSTIHAFKGTVLLKALQFPNQHEITVVVGDHLAVRHLLGVIQPVDSGSVGNLLGKTALQATYRLNDPHGHIQHMNSLVSQFTVSVVPKESPVVVESIWIKWSLRCRSQPGIIVHLSGCRAIRWVA